MKGDWMDHILELFNFLFLLVPSEKENAASDQKDTGKARKGGDDNTIR